MAASKLTFLEEAGKLKRLQRRGWLIKGIDKPETISGHMYRMSLMPLMILENFADMDKNKIIKLCLIHDLAECIVGDITPHDNIGKEEKHKRETKAINYLATLLPNVQSIELKKLFNEYEDQKTPESQITKDFDIFDMVHQAFEYEKLEFTQTGMIPDLSEFFCSTKVLSRIKNSEINDLVNEIVNQRDKFWKEKSNSNNIINVDSETLLQSNQLLEKNEAIQVEGGEQVVDIQV